jgi:hypothetical protein
MKLKHFSVIAVAFAATSAHAQLNLLNVIQSAQSALTQRSSQDKPDMPSGTAPVLQASGPTAQQVWAQKSADAQQQHAQDMAAKQAQENAFLQQQQAQADAGHAAGDERVRAAEEYHEKAQQEDAQRAAQAAKQARAGCPDLANSKKLGLGGAMVTCKNKGMPEEQMMATLGDVPLAAQAYLTAIVQDIYEDNVTNPSRGNDVSDYYEKCYRRGTPCARPQW